MGGEVGRQTNHTVSIQHEHALSVNNIDQGILKDKGGRRGRGGGGGGGGEESKTNDICECFYSRQLIPREYRNQQKNAFPNIHSTHLPYYTCTQHFMEGELWETDPTA